LHTAGAGEANIDEQIGDFETLANPTVGLAAHSGIVDIRIAAKARTEVEADRMIAEVEGQMRERLGAQIFGVDEDTLEGVALKAASERTWNLVAVESGLSGVLRRRLSNVSSQNLLGVASVPLSEGQLSEYLYDLQTEYNARTALGISAFPEKRVVEMALITPEGTQERRLTFGGHPALLPRWAVNVALNWLRCTAEGHE
jgi:nicotinamide-nucleotide amidase